MNNRHLILLSKMNKPGTSEIKLYAQQKFKTVTTYEGKIGDTLPSMNLESTDIIISYLSPWIIPEFYLKKVAFAINFHPGPPEYPGSGCFNFALANGARQYGITCHHMSKKVDSGRIIKVIRFPICEDESVYSLTLKSYSNMQALCMEIIDLLVEEKTLPDSNERWNPKPTTRNDLENLCKIDFQLTKEYAKIINATTYPGMPGAYFTINGNIYTIKRDREREQKQ